MEKNIKKCLWCGNETELSKTHIIPYVLGGRTWAWIACKKCNNFFGDHVESEILKNSVFTAALKKLGLKNSEEAYRFAKKIDSSTGNPIIFVEDNAEVEPHMVSENHFRAKLKELVKYKNAQINKKQKEFPTEDIKETKINDNLIQFEVGNNIYRYTKHSPKQANINIGGLTRYPDVDLICKITLEMASVLDVISEPIFKNFKKEFVKVKQSSKKNEILFAKNKLSRLYFPTTNQEYDKIQFKENFEYKPFHSIYFWITKNDNLYVDTYFFDALKCTLILGKISKEERENIEIICLYKYMFSWIDPTFEIREINKSNYNEEKLAIIADNNRFVDKLLSSLNDKDSN